MRLSTLLQRKDHVPLQTATQSNSPYVSGQIFYIQSSFKHRADQELDHLDHLDHLGRQDQEI